MTNTVTISYILDTTNPMAELGFEAWVDDTKFVDIEHVTEKQQISIQIPDTAADHELRFVLKNKTDKHTRVDENNDIISDSTLTITNLLFDEIKLGHMLTSLAVYRHNFNGHGNPTEDKFYSSLGCNGTVSLKFATPLYLWLLEHM